MIVCSCNVISDHAVRTACATDLPPLKWSSLRYGFDHGGYDGEEEAYG